MLTILVRALPAAAAVAFVAGLLNSRLSLVAFGPPTLLAVLSTLLLYLVIGIPLARTLPLWAGVAVLFIGCFWKFWYMQSVPNDQMLLHTDMFTARFNERADLVLDTYWTMALGWLSVCAGGTLACFTTRPWTSGVDRIGIADRRLARLTYRQRAPVVLIAVVVAAALSGYLQYRYGVSVMGAENVSLPFRSSGLIVYSRNIAIPHLLICLAIGARMAGASRWEFVVVGLLMAHAIIQTLLVASRGLGLFFLAPLAISLVLRRDLTKGVVTVFGVMIVAFVLARPILSEFRTYRVSGPTHDIVGAISYATEQVRSDDPESLGDATSSLGRFSGYEGVLAARSLGAVDWSARRTYHLYFGDERSFSRMFTEDIVGYGYSPNHTAAPTLFGALYALGGNYIVVVGAALWVFTVMLLWRYLLRLMWATNSACLGLVLMQVITVTGEGTFESIGKTGAATAASFLLAEMVVRACLGVPVWSRKPGARVSVFA